MIMLRLGHYVQLATMEVAQRVLLKSQGTLPLVLKSAVLATLERLAGWVLWVESPPTIFLIT
jgi:hypothetical protein